MTRVESTWVLSHDWHVQEFKSHQEFPDEAAAAAMKEPIPSAHGPRWHREQEDAMEWRKLALNHALDIGTSCSQYVSNMCKEEVVAV